MGLSTREGPRRFIEGRHDGGTSFGIVRPRRETNSVRPTVHRFRASHPKGRNEVEHPGGAAGGVDGRGRGGTLGMLRTGGRLTRRGLAGPCARGDGGGGPRAPREWITRARLRRASGVAAARARSAPGVDRGRAMRPFAWRRPRRRGWGSPRARRSGARVDADEPCGLMHGEGRGGDSADSASEPHLYSLSNTNRRQRRTNGVSGHLSFKASQSSSWWR